MLNNESEKLNEALNQGEKSEDCNNPEVRPLLKAGERIKSSAFKEQPYDLEFKERLRARILEKRHSKNNMQEKIKDFSNRLGVIFRSRLFMPIVAAVVLIAIIAATFNFWPRGTRNFSRLFINEVNAQDNFEVLATKSDTAGVDNDTAFIIKSKEAITDAAQLKSNIKLMPAVEFDLKKVSDHEFNVIPKVKLDDRKVYQLLIASSYINDNGLQVDRNFSWAFQVKEQFKILHTLPANQSVDVPVNTGIEVIFSNENFTDFEQSFSIEPKVEGRFEKHGRTGVFVPAKPLAQGKIYTVTIQPNARIEGSSEKMDEEYAFSFETTFNRPDRGQTYLGFSDVKYEFSAKVAPSFNIYTNIQDTNLKAEVNLFTYKDKNKFFQELKKIYDLPSWSSYRQSLTGQDKTAGLTKVVSYNMSVFNQDYNQYLVLPEALPAGFYLLEARLGSAMSYVLIQITDVSAYVQVNKDKTLVWANSLASKQPIANATIINLKDNSKARTDNNGVAAFTTPASKEYEINYFDISSGGQSLIMPVYFNGYMYNNYDSPNNRYWNYLYTDRSLYKPNDTINIWGLIKPRSGGAPAPTEATLSLEMGGYFDYYNDPISLVEKKVTIDNKGMFTGELKFNNLLPGYYNLSLRIPGEKEAVRNSYLRVETYNKPAYELIVTPRKKVMYAGEDAVYDIKARFFDGTPVANLDLMYLHDQQSGQVDGVVKTDEQGQAVLSFKTSWAACAENCSTAYQDRLSLSPAKGEIGEIVGLGVIGVYGPKMHFTKSEAVKNENLKAKLKVEIKNVDLTNEASGYLGGPAANISVTAKVTKIEYITTQVGTYYDFINKITYPKYEYKENRVILPDFFMTTNAAGQAEAELNLEKGKSYEIKYFAKDQDGKTLSGSGYVYGGYFLGNPLFENYFLQAKDNHEAVYSVGENIKLDIIKNQEPVKAGYALVSRHQLGLSDYRLEKSSEINFTFEGKNIPNVLINSVWFDGVTYHEVAPYTAVLKRETRGLKVNVTADKAEYAPRGEVILNVKTQTLDNKRISAEVNLNIVDAAFVSLGGASAADPLSLYNPVDSGLLYSLFSHHLPKANGGAEMGGGGDGGPRSLFPDVALFKSVKTNNRGEAQIKFALPDNITTWNVTAQAISDDLYASAGEAEIKATLPFFVQPTIAEEYLAADKPVISVSAYGQAIKANDQIKIFAEAKTLNLAKTEATTPAFKPAYFTLNNLVEGQHEILTGGEHKNNKDSVLSKVNIKTSRMTEVKKDYYKLDAGVKINGAENGWTKLTFLDAGRGELLNEILNLRYASGSRLDQKLAQKLAYNLVKNYYSAEEAGDEPNLDLTVYQDQNGGLKLLPYASPEPELSAKVAALGADYFSRGSLAAYFYNELNNNQNREEKILAVYGLAALREPVLLIIRDFTKLNDLKPMEKAYLALAAQSIGDGNLARELYNELLSRYGEESSPYARLKIDQKNNDNNIRITMLMAELGAGLGDNKAEQFWKYAMDNRPIDWLLNLEEVSYLNRLLPNLPAGKVKFSLKAGNRSVEKELERNQTYSIMVNSDELKNISWNIRSGQVALVAEYNESSQAGDIKNNYLSVVRKYFINGQETKSFKQGDIVEIRLYPRLSAQALSGNYQITDLLPSGLKLISNMYGRGLEYGCSTYYPDQVNGQAIRFSLWQDWAKYSCNKGDYIRYYARVIAPGTYGAEPALIQSEKSPAMKDYSGYETVNIEK